MCCFVGMEGRGMTILIHPSTQEKDDFKDKKGLFRWP